MKGTLVARTSPRAVAFVVGAAGSAQAIGFALLASSLGEEPAASAAALIALVALVLAAMRPFVPSLMASTFEPRHLGATAVHVAIAMLGPSVIGLGPTLVVVVALSTGWAWWHRAVFVRDTIEEGGSSDRALTIRLGLLAVCGGVPMTLWGLPIFLDGACILEPIVWCSSSRFQRVAVTREGSVVRLFLDGHLQLSSDDEVAYHETLVHPALSLLGTPRTALVLGGGDGLVVRELLRHPGVERIVVVDIDAAVTSLARELPAMAAIGGASLSDRRVTLVHDDALVFLARTAERFDAILVDLPDPTSELLAPLFARETFERMRGCLAPGGVLSVQAGSPRFSREAFSSVAHTITASGLSVMTGAVSEPRSFGGTAVAIGTESPRDAPSTVPVVTRWLTSERLGEMFSVRSENRVIDAEITTLARPAVLHYLRAANARLGRESAA